jgi:hypothetical protein
MVWTTVWPSRWLFTRPAPSSCDRRGRGCSAGNLLQDDAGTFGCVVRDKTGIGGGPGDGRVPGRARRSLASLGEIPAGLSRRILREFVTTVVAPAVTGAA